MATHESLLKDLLELHDLSKKNLAHDYEAVRRIRREQDAKWEEVRIMLYGQPEIDNKPRTESQKVQWDKRSKAVAATRTGKKVEKVA